MKMTLIHVRCCVFAEDMAMHCSIRMDPSLFLCVLCIAVKKLLHFANSNRNSATSEDTDQHSAELLIGLGNIGSKQKKEHE